MTTQLSRLMCVLLGKPTESAHLRRKVEWSRILYKDTFCIKVTMMMMMMMMMIDNNNNNNNNNVGRYSSVGIATRYGLDGPGIESQ